MTHHNGGVRAWDIFFHQCLWVTKLCAASGDHILQLSHTVDSRFSWKEPAPLINDKQKIKDFQMCYGVTDIP